MRLAVDRGELLLLCGTSGGGKSTLLRLLMGIAPQLTGGALHGSVTTLGRDATRVAPHLLAAAGATLVAQNPMESFVADSVVDEVAFGPENLGVPTGELDARISGALAAVGLTAAGSRRLRELSGGEQQRVAIAAALALRPRLLLVDEPTAHLDEPTAREILLLLASLRRSAPLTVVLAEHRLGIAAPLADRCAVLVDGDLVALGPPREALAGPDLAARGVPVPRASQVALRGALGPPLPLGPDELAGRLRPHANGTGGAGRRSSGNTVLSFEAVSYRHPGAAREALTGVSLTVQAGEAVALVGPSGAGKSTLAHLALGLLRAARGTVVIQGRRAERRSIEDIARDAALVVQNPVHQLFTERVEAEIALALRGRPDAARRVRELLERFELTALASRHPLTLSEGQRRRVALAAALARSPALLVLDEPTLGQDERQREVLVGVVAETVARGGAVLAVSHDPEFTNDACDRAIVLRDGRCVADVPFTGDPDGVARLRDAGVPLGDVPATVLALADRGVRLAARSVDELVRAAG